MAEFLKCAPDCPFKKGGVRPCHEMVDKNERLCVDTIRRTFDREAPIAVALTVQGPNVIAFRRGIKVGIANNGTVKRY